MAEGRKATRVPAKNARHQGRGAAARPELSEAAGASGAAARAADLDRWWRRRCWLAFRWCWASAGGQQALCKRTALASARDFEERCEVCHYAGLRRRARCRLQDVPRWRGASRQVRRYRRIPTPAPRARSATWNIAAGRRWRGRAMATARAAIATSRRTPPACNWRRRTSPRSGRASIPSFAAIVAPDARPLRLNHAIHMPAEPTVIRGMKLPMQCADCHRTDPASPTGDPVAGDLRAELQVLPRARTGIRRLPECSGPSVPAPHTKDPQTIQRVHPRDLPPGAGRGSRRSCAPAGQRSRRLSPVRRRGWIAWCAIRSVSVPAEMQLLPRDAGMDAGFPGGQKVNRIRGRYVESSPKASPGWSAASSPIVRIAPWNANLPRHGARTARRPRMC